MITISGKGLSGHTWWAILWQSAPRWDPSLKKQGCYQKIKLNLKGDQCGVPQAHPGRARDSHTVVGEDEVNLAKSLQVRHKEIFQLFLKTFAKCYNFCLVNFVLPQLTTPWSPRMPQA